MRKAQLTIEYIIILVTMLLLFNAITLDLIRTSLDDTGTLQTAEMVNSSRMVLADAIKIVSLQGSGAKKTVSLRAPPDCDYVLYSGSTSIYLKCIIGSPSYALFDEVFITPDIMPAGVSFSIPGGVIVSGELGTVTVKKA